MNGGQNRPSLCVRKTIIVQTVWPACVVRWIDHNIDCELEFVIKASLKSGLSELSLWTNSPPMKAHAGTVLFLVANRLFDSLLKYIDMLNQ